MDSWMTVEQVRERVAEIRSNRHDDERAHSEEDALWGDVLQCIADGGENAAELAAEALKTGQIDFARWCA